MEYIKREYMSSFDVSINLPFLIPINDWSGIALIVNWIGSTIHKCP